MKQLVTFPDVYVYVLSKWTDKFFLFRRFQETGYIRENKLRFIVF